MPSPEYVFINGSAEEWLPEIEASSIDCVITDPPYGDTQLAWDTAALAWTSLVLPLLKPHGSMWVFGSMKYLFKLWPFLAPRWTLAQDIVWEKHNGSSFHADRFKRVHEHVLHLYPAGVAWGNVYREVQTTLDATKKTVHRKTRPPHAGHIENSQYTSEDGGPRLMRSVHYVRSCHGHAIHPTQKPVDLLSPLIKFSCPVGGTVLDPFAGSAASGEASLRSGRAWIGIERDPDYYAKAKERLEALP